MSEEVTRRLLDKEDQAEEEKDLGFLTHLVGKTDYPQAAQSGDVDHHRMSLIQNCLANQGGDQFHLPQSAS